MKTITHNSKSWRLHRETETRLIFVPAENHLAKWRKKNNLTQRQAAEKLGISQTYLAKIELGTRVCPVEVLEKISK